MAMLKVEPRAANAINVEIYQYQGREKGDVKVATFELSTSGDELHILHREGEFSPFEIIVDFLRDETGNLSPVKMGESHSITLKLKEPEKKL